MKEIITLDLLTNDSVSIKKQGIITSTDGKQYLNGKIWRRAYINSPKGRQQLKEEVQEPYLTAILSIWGQNPTMTDE